MAPRLNQIGFLPQARKVFALAVPQSGPLSDFDIVRDDGIVVLSGTLSPDRRDLSAVTGEFVAQGDFTRLSRPGRYRVRAGGALSHPFVVGDGIYRPLLRDAARCFDLIRANAVIDDPLTGIKIAAGHAGDAHIAIDGRDRDLTGGWYNAGDFGKYTHMAAMSVSHMLRLYELRPQTASLGLDMAPLYPGLPDVLQLARWGLEWLLKMQNEDGGVLHKVDSQPILTWGKLPADDPAPRKAMAPSTIDAGVFTGVMGHASRAWPEPAFAARCRKAAEASWVWLKAHRNVPHDDAYYRDPDPIQGPSGRHAKWRPPTASTTIRWCYPISAPCRSSGAHRRCWA